MDTVKDMIINTTLHHLRQFSHGPPDVDEQIFVQKLTIKRVNALARSAMRTAAKFQACLRVWKNAKQLVGRLLSWYNVDGRAMMLLWQAECKTDVELLVDQVQNKCNSTEEVLLDRGLVIMSQALKRIASFQCSLLACLHHPAHCDCHVIASGRTLQHFEATCLSTSTSNRLSTRFIMLPHLIISQSPGNYIVLAFPS